MKFKNILAIYMYLYVLSGLVYSMMTAKLINYQLGNKFYILFLDAIVNIIVFYIIYYFRNRLSFPIVTLIIGISISILYSFFNTNNIISLSFFYLFLTLLIDFDLIDSENQIIEIKGNDGMRQISMFGNFSHIIGFFIGTFITHFDTLTIGFFLLLGFILKYFEQSRTNNPHKSSPSPTFRGQSFHLNIRWLFLLFLSSTTVFWIPIFIAKLTVLNQQNFYFIPFVLPGIISILMLYFSNKIPKQLLISLYLISLVAFALVLDKNIWLSIIVFSSLVGFNVVINMWLRNQILMQYAQNQHALVLEAFELFNCLIILLFSGLSLILAWIPLLLLCFDFIGALILLLMNRKLIL